MKNVLKLAGAGAVMMVALAAHAGKAAETEEHPAVKRAFDLPPSVELTYSIGARQRGFNLNGDATVTWRQGDSKYAVTAESRVALLGKLTETRSTGTIDNYGIAPAEYSDKRLRKDAVTATFDRDAKSIGFSDGKDTYPIKGGEQDRASISWQLVAVARAAKDKFKAGSEWQFFVVGPHDADPWTFRVVGREKVQAGAAFGMVDAVHVLREAPPGTHDQTLDIWLAPGHEWYPVKLRFTDNDRDYVEQTLEKITKK
jgi:hypothetical protein